MKYLTRFLADTILDIYDGFIRMRNIFREKPQPSLIVSNVLWCTNSEWMDRLVAYRQLELWTDK